MGLVLLIILVLAILCAGIFILGDDESIEQIEIDKGEADVIRTLEGILIAAGVTGLILLIMCFTR